MEDKELCPDVLLPDALIEANEELQKEVTRLRRVIKILRVSNSVLRDQVRRAHENDEQFKALCQEGEESFTD